MERTGSLAVAFSGVAFIYAASIAIARSALFAQAPGPLAVGVTIDLTFTSMAIVYLVGVRRRALPRAALAVVFVAGLAAARLIVPEGAGAVTTALAVPWAAAELVIAATALARLRRVVARTRAARREGRYFVSALEGAMESALPFRRMASALAVEIAAIRYALGGWFARTPAGGFTVHRRRAWGLIAGVLGWLVLVETALLHMLIARVSPVAAWIATATSLYALLWLAGDAHALRLQPLRIAGTELIVEIGLRWRAAVPLREIESVERIETAPAPGRDLLRGHLLWPNILISLHNPVQARGPLGLVREVRRLSLSVDEPEAFLAALTSAR